MASTSLHCETILLADGWARNVRLEIDGSGTIVAIERDVTRGASAAAHGPVVPGMPNLHSHAFQRAMAGIAERAGEADDSFWTWRETMYRLVRRLRPEHVHAIAAQAYVEMLKAGYTAVAEFHYLHHQPDGAPHGRLAELSDQVIRAALRTGIAITHLPVLYQQGGFGGAATGAAQARFLNSIERHGRLVGELARAHADEPLVRLGFAAHSLRAVPPEALAGLVALREAHDSTAPIHLHVAEQRREVEECVAWSGKRPVTWLLDNAEVGPGWCLVHATHMSEAETDRLAASGAVAGLCPTTEGNLGDGFFPAARFLAAGGAFGIGSDSQISISPAEELRWLEYGQRLLSGRRAVLAGSPGEATGARLYRGALAGGARALGQPVGALASGLRADLVVIDPEHGDIGGRNEDDVLDGLVFAAHGSAFRDVMVAGRWVVREGHHAAEREVAAAYRSALKALDF